MSEGFVRIVEVNEEAGPDRAWMDYAEWRYVGRVGRIVRVEDRGVSGDSPDDPIFMIRFSRRERRGKTRHFKRAVPGGVDGFWTEEVTTSKRPKWWRR